MTSKTSAILATHDSVSIIIKSVDYHVAIYETNNGEYECTFVDESSTTNHAGKFIELFTSKPSSTILESFQEFYQWYSNSEYYGRNDNKLIRYTIENFIFKMDYP
jgi:hypothetical protein